MYHRTTDLLRIKMEQKEQKGSIHLYPSPSLPLPYPFSTLGLHRPWYSKRGSTTHRIPASFQFPCRWLWSECATCFSRFQASWAHEPLLKTISHNKWSHQFCLEKPIKEYQRDENLQRSLRMARSFIIIKTGQGLDVEETLGICMKTIPSMLCSEMFG